MNRDFILAAFQLAVLVEAGQRYAITTCMAMATEIGLILAWPDSRTERSNVIYFDDDQE